MTEDVPQMQWIPSFGEQLVGLSFNPSNDPKVQRAKELCAELADLLHEHVESKSVNTALELVLYDKAKGDILDAQMNVVKVLTLNK